MANKHYLAGEAITSYVQGLVREPPVLRNLREETARHPEGFMQISPEQGGLLHMWVKMLRALHTLEIGVFTGYSSLAVALALPEDGTVTACDSSEEYTQVARRYWKEAGVAGKMRLHLGNALESLSTLPAGSFDMAFIDADKPSYDSYYERCLRLVRPGGLIVLDNMLYHGRVHDAGDADPNASALRALNLKIASDERVDFTLLPVADGMVLALVR